MARVDLAERYSFVNTFGISVNNVPAVYVFFDDKLYIHDLDSTEGSIDDPTTLLHLMNKLMYPLLQLDSEEAIEQFLDLKQEPQETTKFMKNAPMPLEKYYKNKSLPARALSFIFDKDEYSEELKYIRTAARNSARREGLRFGIVTDTYLIRKYKQRYGSLWFGDAVQLNGFVVKRFDG